MLFNSPIFVFAFLPTTFLGYFLLGRLGGRKGACALLTFASLVYYGWWNPKYLLLIIPATGINGLIGKFLCLSGHDEKLRRTVVIGGVGLNLGLLAYFKYANFFVGNLNTLIGANYTLGAIILPLGISFFVFQKIAFLVDAYRG